MRRIIYSTGDKIGNCTYISEQPKQAGHRYALFICPVCSNTFSARISHVKTLAINTCGCLNIKHMHGQSNTRLYHIWEAMLQRCNNKNHKKYKDYGARGITVCEEWQLFTAFEAWAVTNGYSSTLTLDRINTDSSYTPINCRWATRATQQANRRKQQTCSYIGVEKQRNGKFSARICHEGNRFTVGIYSTDYAAAIARDQYILTYNLPHTLSILTRSTCQASPSTE